MNTTDCAKDFSEGLEALIIDTVKMCCMSVGLVYFILLLSIDLGKSLKGKPHTRWIPGKTLILSALTIQILSYLNYKNISISDQPDPAKSEELSRNRIVIDSGRLVICVFIGYMLPGMASPRFAAQWSEIAALAISLFTAITSELYYIRKVEIGERWQYCSEYYWSYFFSYSGESSHLVSSLTLLVCTVMLILFLVVAILAGKSVRGMLARRIPLLLKRCSDSDGFENKIVRSWFLCRVGQPQYVIARSVLSSATGLVVTVCIVTSVVRDLIYGHGISYSYEEWTLLRIITFGLQCTFVFLGWAVILLRWLSAVFYFSTFSSGSVCQRRSVKYSWTTLRSVCQRCCVEDFWTRSICESIHMYDIYQWLPNNHGKCMAKIVAFGAKLQYLVLGMSKVLVFFSKCC